MTAPRPIDVVRKEAMLDNGEVIAVLVPKQRWLFDRMFQPDHDYTIEIHEPRSTRSHNHFFAAVHEAWKNLPDHLAEQHPDSEHLRKWALIKCGFSIKHNIVCENNEKALEVAAVAGRLNESAVIVVQGKVVTIATARTQKTTGPNCMNKEEFQQSKQAVLDYVAGLLGVDASTLSSQVSHSSDASTESPSRDRTDTPAASGPQPSPAAGVTLSDKPSQLIEGWRDIYINVLTQSSNRAMLVASRDTMALRQIGGPPTELEREWMRRVATTVNRRDRGKINAKEFQTEIEALRSAPLSSLQHGDKDAA